MPSLIDFRSDTLTQPTAGMRAAMAEAEVGGDLFGEDPTVNRLQERMADLTGKDTALFVASGTMGNQVAIAAHTRPGMEVILDADSHSVHFESGAVAMLSGVQVRTLQGRRGILTAAQVAAAIRPAPDYFPETGLVQLENTHNVAGGVIYPLEALQAVYRLAVTRRLRVHLDGARLWHAAVETGILLREYAACADSVMLCFSKGLGAPVGSILVGSSGFIQRAHRFRKALGGAMRQSGVLAAAALYALDHHLDHLRDDHAVARALAAGLAGFPRIEIDAAGVETNMVYAGLPRPRADSWVEAAGKAGVRMLAMGDSRVRFVTHRDLPSDAVPRALTILSNTWRETVQPAT